MVVDPQIATTITEAICTPVEITTVIVLDMAVRIMVIMGEAYSTITTHLEACLEEEGILLHWEPVQDFWVEPWQVSQLCLCTTGILSIISVFFVLERLFENKFKVSSFPFLFLLANQISYFDKVFIVFTHHII